MATGLSAIVLPTVVSSGGFAMRRLGKAKEANDAAQTTMNSVVASGQIERAAECSANIAKDKGDAKFVNFFMSAEENIKNAAKSETAVKSSVNIFKTVGKNLLKALKFVGDYVNEFILITSGIKVITSKDPVREGTVEGAGVVGMLAVTEPLYKRMAGMATYERKNGKLITHEHTPLIFKLPYAEQGAEAVKDYFETKKFFGMTMKHVPKVLKGLGLIASSVFGYWGFRSGAEYMYDKMVPCKEKV